MTAIRTKGLYHVVISYVDSDNAYSSYHYYVLAVAASLALQAALDNSPDDDRGSIRVTIDKLDGLFVEVE